MIKLKYTPNSLTKQEIAYLVAAQLNWPKWDFQAYCPNKSDYFFWTVDEGNDWKLKFIQEEPGELWIYHRYGANEKINKQVQLLGEWLIARFGFTKIID